ALAGRARKASPSLAGPKRRTARAPKRGTTVRPALTAGNATFQDSRVFVRQRHKTGRNRCSGHSPTPTEHRATRPRATGRRDPLSATQRLDWRGLRASPGDRVLRIETTTKRAELEPCEASTRDPLAGPAPCRVWRLPSLSR